MRKTIAAAILALPLVLGGCATTGDATTGLKAFIAQVQAITREACGFLPLAETIAAILSAGSFSSASAIANAVCKAVTEKPPAAAPGARSAPRRAMVGNVPVKGRFVK